MRNKKGISLIVLVITIIVMILLAASVVISLSSTGIINKANDAANKTDFAQVQQYATLIWSEEYLNNKRGDTLKNDVLGKLEEYKDKYDFDITDTGINVTEKGAGAVIDWNTIIADANANPEKYKHPDQSTSADIGIGTDGQPVNMDLWNWVKNSTTSNKMCLATARGSGKNAGYIGTYTADGQIIGKVPQYIKPSAESEFFPVEYMSSTFISCSGLKIAPEIPTTVIYMNDTFYNCSNLTTAPVIPSSVEVMTYTFGACAQLTGDLVINANPTAVSGCLYNTATSGATLKLSGASTVLADILATKSDGSNISIK